MKRNLFLFPFSRQLVLRHSKVECHLLQLQHYSPPDPTRRFAQKRTMFSPSNSVNLLRSNIKYNVYISSRCLNHIILVCPLTKTRLVADQLKKDSSFIVLYLPLLAVKVPTLGMASPHSVTKKKESVI